MTVKLSRRAPIDADSGCACLHLLRATKRSTVAKYMIRGSNLGPTRGQRRVWWGDCLLSLFPVGVPPWVEVNPGQWDDAMRCEAVPGYQPHCTLFSNS